MASSHGAAASRAATPPSTSAPPGHSEDPRATAHTLARSRSARLLEEARSDARQKRKYDSSATHAKIATECQARAGLTPYAEQLDLAECMLLGVDAVTVAGTGWGKTLPFVLALFVPETKGKIVVIVSPLNALEADQAERFREMGLKATTFNGQTKSPTLLKEIERGDYSVVIMGPKLLVAQNSPTRALFSRPQFNKKILAVIIDEAHCITQWGGDFRPEYSELAVIRALLPIRVAVHVTSATLPPPALSQACKTVNIDLEQAFYLNLGNDRRNIYWEVRIMKAGQSDLAALALLLPDPDEPSPTLRRTMVFFDNIFLSMKARRWLLEHLPPALHPRVKEYNARRSREALLEVMWDFRSGEVDILFATEAAGMGCDISTVQHVVQFMAPESLSVWTQRAGR